jgi:hypothetical protein
MSTANYQDAIKGFTGVIQAYAVATRQHDKLTEDAWAVMAREISAALKSGKGLDGVKADMKAAEDTWKAATGETSMPSTYRSAKAVALKGVAASVDLLDKDGNPKGKTAIEKEYKAKESVAVASGAAPEQVKDSPCDAILKKLDKHWSSFTEAERSAIVHKVGLLIGGSK